MPEQMTPDEETLARFRSGAEDLGTLVEGLSEVHLDFASRPGHGPFARSCGRSATGRS